MPAGIALRTPPTEPFVALVSRLDLSVSLLAVDAIRPPDPA